MAISTPLARGVLQSSINSGLAAEMDAHLGYGSGDRAGKAAAGQTNSRNGSYSTTVDTHYGPIDIDIPRDRDGTFIPRMVPKGARRITELDDIDRLVVRRRHDGKGYPAPHRYLVWGGHVT